MAGIFTDPIASNRGLTNLGIDAIPTSLGDVVEAAAEEAWARNPLPSLGRWAERQSFNEGSIYALLDPPNILSAQDATDRYGIDGHLSFDADTPEPVAAELRQLKQEELYRQSIMARGPTGLARSVAELGTSFVVGAIDPINIASAFVPVIGPARYALALEQAGGALARTGIRLGLGGVEGLAGAAMVEPLVYGVARSEQADYHAVDSMLNLAFGTALGGGLHAGLGGAGDALAHLRGRDYGFTHDVDAEAQRRMHSDRTDTAYVRDALTAFGLPRPDASALVQSLAAASPQTREALLRAAIAQTVQDRPVALRTLARLDPALRGEMLEMGRVIDAAVADPLGPMDAAIARLSPQVMEDVLFQKGEAILTETGDLLAEGNPYKRRMGGHDGALGAVKLLVKHGEYSDKAGTRRQVYRENIIELPRILREWQPDPDKTRTDERGAVTAQQWVVERADGEYIRYVLNRDGAGEMVTATIHVLDDKAGVKLSEKRAAPVASPGGLSAGDTKAAGIAHRPTEAAGATPPSYTRSRPPRQRAGNAHVPQAVFDGGGKRIMVRYELVDIDSLVTSHDDDLRVNPAFPPELQPRQRERAAGEAQINDIAARLEPERLGQSSEAATGAPIIGKGDQVVESGNGRVLALRRVYAMGGEKADAYKAFLTAQGFDIRAFAHPVLVRRRLDDLSADERQAFTVMAQKSGTLDLSASERALADAGRIDSVLPLLENENGRVGDLGLARNQRFVRAFIDTLAQSDQGAMLTADGQLSRDGRQRIEAALLARAYGDADLLSRMVEADDDNSRAIIGALLDVSADWAVMRAAAGRGVINPGVDATAELVAAVRLVRDARAGNRPLAEIRAQADMFAAPSPLIDRFLGVLLRADGEGRVRSAGRDSIANDLSRYVDQAMKSSPDPDMFGTKPPGPDDLLDLLGREIPAGSIGDDMDDAAIQALDDLLADSDRIDALDDAGVDAEIGGMIDAGLVDARADDLVEAGALIDQGRADADAAQAAASCMVGGLA